MAASELRRRGHVSSIGMAFLVGGAITTAAACYFVFASGPPAMDFVAAPTSTSREGHVMAGTDAEHEHTLTKSPIEPAPPQLSVTEDRVTGDTNLMTRPTSVDRIAIAVEDTKPPIGKDSQFVAATAQGSNCFASASAVRQNHPEAGRRGPYEHLVMKALNAGTPQRARQPTTIEARCRQRNRQSEQPRILGLLRRNDEFNGDQRHANAAHPPAGRTSRPWRCLDAGPSMMAIVSGSCH